jgi:toxin CptA
MKSAPAIAFDYLPSRWLLAAVIAVSGLALLAIALSGVALWSKGVLALAACVYAGRALIGLRKPLICRCAWYESGHWRVRDASGQELEASLRQASVRGSCIVLRLHSPPAAFKHAGPLPDNCDADTRRRLRVRLARADPVAANAEKPAHVVGRLSAVLRGFSVGV